MGNKNSGRTSWVKQQKYECENCGKTFYDYPSNRTSDHVFCTKKCSAIFNFSKPKPKCLVCGKPVKLHRNQFCSRECRGLSQKNGKIITCAYCGKQKYYPLHRLNVDNNYCSMECKQNDCGALLHKMRDKLKEIRLNNGKTLPEQIMEDILIKLKLNYISEYKLGKYFIDFFLSDYNLCIEVDGDYWHCNFESDKFIGSKQQLDAHKRDIEKNQFLNENGYSILRVWESELKTKEGTVYDNIKETIRKFTRSS